jgi:hypothetical protein
LRDAIVHSIKDATAGIYQQPSHPVRILLQIDEGKLREIIQENSDFSPTGEEDHFRKWQIQHPGEALDPDLPPPEEIVKAIEFLRQKRLPGSLLGQWQFPLPKLSLTAVLRLRSSQPEVHADSAKSKLTYP